MTNKHPESRKLKLDPIPEDLACPTLLISSNGLLPRLLSSFSGALGISVALCGVLASIAISRHLAQPALLSVPALTTHLDKGVTGQLEEVETAPQVHSRNLPALPPPIKMRARIPEPRTETSPSMISTPTLEHTPTEFLEELEFDNPFAEKSLSTKQTPPQPTRSNLRDMKVEEQKRMARQREALAKKMAKTATLISRATPTYPRSAKRKNIQGRVVVTVTIGTSGSVLGSKIRQSSGDSSLDQAALSAAKKFRFRAALNGLGQPIASSKAIPFNFQLR